MLNICRWCVCVCVCVCYFFVCASVKPQTSPGDATIPEYPCALLLQNRTLKTGNPDIQDDEQFHIRDIHILFS